MGGRLSREQVSVPTRSPKNGLAEALGVISLGMGSGGRKGRGRVCQEEHRG